MDEVSCHASAFVSNSYEQYSWSLNVYELRALDRLEQIHSLPLFFDPFVQSADDLDVSCEQLTISTAASVSITVAPSSTSSSSVIESTAPIETASSSIITISTATETAATAVKTTASTESAAASTWRTSATNIYFQQRIPAFSVYHVRVYFPTASTSTCHVRKTSRYRISVLEPSVWWAPLSSVKPLRPSRLLTSSRSDISIVRTVIVRTSLDITRFYPVDEQHPFIIACGVHHPRDNFLTVVCHVQAVFQIVKLTMAQNPVF
ncbi:unnamed protein product [Acanthoscelides obtectus]|uniref:Uncharacterized protein n=1 Tax=Acanthoscelides obtectus TaxID=200917 RepID=A0A9P0M221_ACAOB|nr:unnamed protein product [Acanthoscelides obtectus]CAK1681745.1 hypothetical protein AOBTE_LOCUS33259 [Acanthoscelides obtectus]